MKKHIHIHLKVHTIAYLVLLASVLSFLLYIGFTRAPYPRVFFEGTAVRCLPEGVNDLALQWKMSLVITVNGEDETIPVNIGNTMRCRTELYTRQNDGTIYIDTYEAGRIDELQFTYFFDVWGVPIEREGFALTIEQDGEVLANVDAVQIRDGSVVRLMYTEIDTATTTATTTKNGM